MNGAKRVNAKVPELIVETGTIRRFHSAHNAMIQSPHSSAGYHDARQEYGPGNYSLERIGANCSGRYVVPNSPSLGPACFNGSKRQSVPNALDDSGQVFMASHFWCTLNTVTLGLDATLLLFRAPLTAGSRDLPPIQSEVRVRELPKCLRSRGGRASCQSVCGMGDLGDTWTDRPLPPF